MALLVKICGLSTEESVEAAIEAGVDMIGLNFVSRSPRYVTLERAARLADLARGRTAIVALVVDAHDSQLAEIASAVAPDLWQFHGQERYERLRDARAVFGRPIIKVIGISQAADVQAVRNFAPLADHILLDAKPPKGAAYPGGHGQPFDWELLAALPCDLPFMLSGGLSPENVGGAIRQVRGLGLRLRGVDVASGVESAPGVKDTGKIRAFVAAARAA